MLQVMPEDKESVKVLKECVDLQVKKSADYQAKTSAVKQAMHYRRGIDSIHDMIHQKILRAQSLIEAAAENQGQVAPNFESIEDTYKDIINYASFAVSYLRGKMEGQDPDNNIFNRSAKQDAWKQANQVFGVLPSYPPSEENSVKSGALPTQLGYPYVINTGAVPTRTLGIGISDTDKHA